MSLTLGSITHESREHPRIKLPAMYTLIRVRKQGHPHFDRTGHIYDISLSGMRFELDYPLDAGEIIDVKIMLPGSSQFTFSASGSVIRLHQEEEPGPARMGFSFHKFHSSADKHRLQQYINYRGFLPEDAPARAA